MTPPLSRSDLQRVLASLPPGRTDPFPHLADLSADALLMRKVEVTSGWVLRSRSRTSWDTASEIRDASKVKRRGTCAFRPTSADGLTLPWISRTSNHFQGVAGLTTMCIKIREGYGSSMGAVWE
jgi:hypothetical protein